MLAMLSVAAVSSVQSLLMQSRGSAPLEYYVSVLAISAPQSVAATVLALGLYWRSKGYRQFFRQPGHWLLLVPTSDLFVGVSGPIVFLLLPSEMGPAVVSVRAILFSLLTFVPLLGTSIALLNAPWSLDLNSSWRGFFVAIGAVRLITSTLMCVGNPWVYESLASSDSNNLVGLAVVVYWMLVTLLLCVAIRSDRRSQRRYHWTHWFGVTAWLCSPGYYLAQWTSDLLG